VTPWTAFSIASRVYTTAAEDLHYASLLRERFYPALKKGFLPILLKALGGIYLTLLITLFAKMCVGIEYFISDEKKAIDKIVAEHKHKPVIYIYIYIYILYIYLKLVCCSYSL
jgi:hypothetical protein